MSKHSECACPFLVPVVADRLWLYPVAVYCRRPIARVRVPAQATLAQTCTTAAHGACQGYREAVRAGDGGR